MKKSALCLLLCLLLALPCLSVAEQSRQVNRSCRIYFANGTELASRLNDGRLLTEVNGAEAVEHTFYIDPNGQTVDAVCVQYGEHILPYVVQAQDAQGDWQQIGAYTGDYAQGYAAFPARSQRFRLVFARDGEKLPLSAVRGKAEDPDPQVRYDAYKAELAAYPQIEQAMAACLNGIKGEGLTMLEANRFDSILDQTLFYSNMDRETLDAMWQASIQWFSKALSINWPISGVNLLISRISSARASSTV